MTSAGVSVGGAPATLLDQSQMSLDTEVEDSADPAPATAALRQRRSINGSVIAGLGLLVLVALWIFAVRVLHVPSYILPAPEAVIKALWSGIAVSPASSKGYYLPLWSTLSNAAVGFAIGTGLGLVLGSLMAAPGLTTMSHL